MEKDYLCHGRESQKIKSKCQVVYIRSAMSHMYTSFKLWVIKINITFCLLLSTYVTDIYNSNSADEYKINTDKSLYSCYAIFSNK